MIVKNEEDVLDRCLTSATGIFDELIIVDTGSIDKTCQIAQNHGAHVYNFPWVDDFAAARNFAFSKATMDYLLWLDADDILDEDNKAAFLQLKQTLSPAYDMVIMKYHVAFDKQGQPTFSYNRERLMKRAGNYTWLGAVHETIPFSGNLLYSEIAISHRKLSCKDPKRNLRIFEKLQNEQTLDSRQQFYYARELYYDKQYQSSIDLFHQFLDSFDGWVENKISACQDLYQCYLAIQQPKKALDSLLFSFRYDVPRAEICCDLGNHFTKNKELEKAIHWYTVATTIPLRKDSGGFIQTDCYDYLPWIQLCCCYDQLHDYEKAQQCNEKAGQFKPQDPSYLHNKAYFLSLANQY